MGGPRFTDFQAVRRVDLSDGDWVEFRKELSFSETQAVESGALVSRMGKTQEIEVEVDWPSYEVVRLASWISDWSFVDADGLREPPTRDAIRKLNQATAQELTAALDAHINASESDPGKAGNGEPS
jgi:hypothetical protein